MRTFPIHSKYRSSRSDFSLLLLLLLSMSAEVQAQYAFTNFVGLPGVSGTNTGTGTAARFNAPTRPAMDSAGNLFVAEVFNHTIRKITPAGEVTTLAGMAGVPGSADGTGSAARFSQPRSVALDATGNIFVPDWGNHTIRKVTPAGVVTTLAGSPGNPGWVDATGTAARFNMPECVTVDANGNVFVAERDNFVIRKVTPAGVVTTLAGNPGVRGWADGTGTAALFNDPSGIAIDSAGNLFVGDRGNDVVRIVTQAGAVTTLTGDPGNRGWADGIGSGALFNRPSGVGVDNLGNVFVTEEGNHTIRKVTSAGMVTTIGGLVGTTGTNDGIGSDARFNTPIGVAVHPTGTLYVSDALNHRITRGTASIPPPPFTWTTNNGTITITGYTGFDAVVTIPSVITGLPVASIGAAAFYRAQLASVIIPQSVTSIEPSAFAYCDFLTNVAMGNGVVIIDTSAFQNCYNLPSVVIPDTVATIGASAFRSCGLTNVLFGIGVTNISNAAFRDCWRLPAIAIPDSVLSLGSEVFRHCDNLASITLGAAVNSIGSAAFRDCERLANIEVDPGNAAFSSQDGVLFDHAQSTLILFPEAKAGNYIIPGTVTSVGDSAFYNCLGLTGVTIPNSVISIGTQAFRNCDALFSVRIPDSVNTLGSWAFYGCFGLTAVTMGNNVTNISDYAFSSCANLTNVPTGAGTIQIGYEAFASCASLTNIVMSNGVVSIGQNAFAGCIYATNLVIPDTVTTIGSGAFQGCASLTSVTLPVNLRTISDGLFYNCIGLNSFTIPSGLNNIGQSAFSSCWALKSITIPGNVTNIGWYAFYSCSALQGAFFAGNAPTVGSYVFDGATNVVVYYLPGTTGWGSAFAGRPTALWNPTVPTADPNFGVQNNQFGFTITGTPNIPVVVEASTNLPSPAWFPLQTSTLTNGSLYFTDPNWTNYPSRLYRIRSP